MSRSLNVNVAPGSRSVGLSLGCARPRPVPCIPSNEPGPQTLHAMLRLIGRSAQAALVRFQDLDKDRQLLVAR